MIDSIKKIIGKKIQPQKYLNKPITVGLMYICVGKYEMFFDDFYNSFQRYFLTNTSKKYFVFTDSLRLKKKYVHHPNIIFIHTEKKGWPYDTLNRNYYFREVKELIEPFHYVFFCNANLICKKSIFLNELGLLSNELFGVIHPSFFWVPSQQFPVEKELNCNAFFNDNEIQLLEYYYQGCFYGGTSNAFIKLVLTIASWMDEDLANNIIPVWHDESYLNRYFFLNKPYALPPSFAYPEYLALPFEKNIIQKAKKNELIR